jgi:hypothetical protein
LLNLILDSPEFEGMDDGEAWSYVERLQHERDEAGQCENNRP